MTEPAVAELVRLAEAEIAAFEVRMRMVVPLYEVGDRLELHGEVFEVAGFEREGMPGYWLKRPGEDVLFLPMDLERVLQPVVQ